MIRNGLALIGLVTVTFFSAGWYLNWYKLDKMKGTNGETAYILEWFPARTKADVSKGIDRAGQVLNDVRDGRGGKADGASGSPVANPLVPAGVSLPLPNGPVQPAQVLGAWQPIKEWGVMPAPFSKK